MKNFVRFCSFCIMLAGIANASAAPPNVIVVFIDDMGYSDLSCFNGDRVTTENIDQLAEEGIRFTQFYVNSPICSPSRVALSTGQYPQRYGITSYLNNRKSNNERGMSQWLDVSAPMLARSLQQAGYATGHFGKWHMGGQRDVDDAPAISEYGFDVSLTNFEGMGAKLLPLTMQPGWEKPGRIWQKATQLGGPVIWMQRSEITKGFVQSAEAFIKEAHREKKPFFVNVWPDDVHAPFFPPVKRWAEDAPGLYDAVLETMDEQFASLFAMIRRNENLRNNTLIVFCSDNGPQDGAGTSDPLRGYKTWLYEGGIRSPLIVWGPGLQAKGTAGSINNTSVFCAMDINRSLYSLCGIEPPAGANLDGEDVLETMLGKSQESRQAPIIWRRPPDRPGFGHGMDEDNPDLAIREGKWKLLVNYDGSDRQLYDLETDAPESNNVIESHPEIAQKLYSQIRAWQTSMPNDAASKSAALPIQ